MSGRTPKPRYVSSSLLPPMTVPEVLALVMCLVAVQVVGVRVGLEALTWPVLAIADVAVWFALVPRRVEAGRRRSAIDSGAAAEVWLP
ncbi:hypothetical protein [Nocardioides montaniterrae]